MQTKVGLTTKHRRSVTYNVHRVASLKLILDHRISAKCHFYNDLENGLAMVFKLLFTNAASPGRRSGCTVIDSTQDAVVQLPQPATKPKTKHSLLPTLIVLFLVSYGLMCLLAVEQDKTIAAQRSLISSLLGDSTELSHLKVKIFQDQHPQQNAASSSQAQEPLTQAPSAQGPMTQAPITQAPMTQDAPAGSSQRSHVAGKVRKSLPAKPPLGIADIVDGRRIANTI